MAPGWGVAAMLLTAGPALIAAAALAAQRPTIYFDGDAAKDELTLINAGRLALLVGNHSRFGWSHPGPAWFYSLDVFYGPLGGASWAFVAANLLINAICMALVVAVVWRARGLVGALLAAGGVLAFVIVIGEQPFRDVWPPYAAIMPMLLFLFLAAAGGAGSAPALAGALVAGSYSVQLHVGTAPTVAAVVAAVLGLRLAWHRAKQRTADEGTSRRRWDKPLVLGGLLLLVLMWIPPAIDQLTGHPGNLTLLWTFFTADYPKHEYPLAISILGRLLAPWNWHQFGTLAGADLSRVSTPYIAIAIAFIGLVLGLIAAATRTRDRFGQSIGIVVLVTCATVTFSIRSISGPVYPYLLLWVTCLPLLLATGWIGLIPRVRLGLHGHTTLALAAPVTALTALVALAFQILPPLANAAPDTSTAWALTSAALSGHAKSPVLVDMYTQDTWVVATGVALQLEKEGRSVRVRDNWVFMFGTQARATGSESTVLVFVDVSDSGMYTAQHPGAHLVGTTAAHAIFIIT